MGPESGLRLQVLDDKLTTAPGQAEVRVIQASLKQQVVTVTLGSTVLASGLKFASVSDYQPVSPGTQSVTVSASGGDAHSSVTLAAGTVHTLVVLDGASGLEVVNLEDASGSGTATGGRRLDGLRRHRAARARLARALAGGHRSRLAARPDRRAEAAPWPSAERRDLRRADP